MRQVWKEDMLTFSEEKHEYRWNGAVVPSVTEIIGEYLDVDINGTTYKVNPYARKGYYPSMFEDAAFIGTEIHKAAAFILRGIALDWDALAPELVGPCRQIEAWFKAYKPTPLLVEEALYSMKYNMAGTPDFFGELPEGRGRGRLSVVDIKTGAHDLVGPQTAGYETLIRENKKNLIDRLPLGDRNRTYQTRHTYASLALKAGEEPLYVAGQMGTSPEMLFSRYARYIPSAGAIIWAGMAIAWYSENKPEIYRQALAELFNGLAEEV